MAIFMLILCVIPTITPITVSSNGNSPEIKMIGGMMVEVQKGFVPMTSKLPPVEPTTTSNYDKSRKLNNSTNLSLNERYRRLIPYMTFYYANDLASTTEAYRARDIEVEKAEIVEARMIQQANQRQQKNLVYTPYRNIPRYQGNRLTQFNILSANPTKVYYNKEIVPIYQNSPQVTHHYNPLTPERTIVGNPDFDHGRFGQKHIIKSPSVPFTPSTRKPYNEDSANVHYYLSENKAPKFKLVPYDQTPPVKFVPQIQNSYETQKPIPVPVVIPKEPIYIKPRPARPQYVYDNVNNPQVNVRKIPVVVSENYYENRRPLLPQPTIKSAIDNGFKPIVGPVFTTEAPVYSTTLRAPIPQLETARPDVQVVDTPVAPEVTNHRPNYYQYVVEEPTYKPEPYVPSRTVSLSDLLNSLQLNKSIPKPITRENVGSSIMTLLQVLNTLKAMSQQNDVEAPLFSTPKPFVAPEEEEKPFIAPGEDAEVTTKPAIEVTPTPAVDVELHEEPYLAPVNTPSQHLDDFSTNGGTSQQFPQPVHSDGEGGTPGRPGVDYPVLPTIPHTSFDCKTQRYKGFFADTETRCQVWHYCDLNGGQASFLCPNGTIFSQAALTCDWWFNVRCASTTQLYVLNESLYKYILPHSPKFPEDYSGPLVDKYLTLKFKEMEEQFKKNKNKQSASEKIDSVENDNSSEDSTEDTESSSEKSEDSEKSEMSTVSEASVMVESPGTSGNVQRLQD